MSPQAHYVGEELDVFATALRWKRYWRAQAGGFIHGDVAEVGAGIGINTSLICAGSGVRSVVCLEPDPRLASRLDTRLRDSAIAVPWRVVVGTLGDLADREQFDSIVYIDVVEHIDDDRGELLRAANHLRPAGTLVILSPAHQWLYTPFDAAIGHYRRYTRRSLAAIVPASLHRETLRYLDSVGLLLSAGNKLLLRSATPTIAQIQLWDNVFVRCSTVLDPLLAYGIGKSVLGVWRKPA